MVTNNKPIDAFPSQMVVLLAVILLNLLTYFSAYSGNSFLLSTLCFGEIALTILAMYGFFKSKKWGWKLIMTNAILLPVLVYIPMHIGFVGSRVYEYWYIVLPILYCLMLPDIIFLSKFNN